jgi:hypothetical protein
VPKYPGSKPRALFIRSFVAIAIRALSRFHFWELAHIFEYAILTALLLSALRIQIAYQDRGANRGKWAVFVLFRMNGIKHFVSGR